MTQLLVIIGVFVFFISVYGAVMVGGHLLEELEASGATPDEAPAPTGPAPSTTGLTGIARSSTADARTPVAM
jgi:hypothetical protein